VGKKGGVGGNLGVVLGSVLGITAEGLVDRFRGGEGSKGD